MRASVTVSLISSGISHPAEATLGPSAGAWEPQHGVITAQGKERGVECQLKDTQRQTRAPGKDK